MAKDKGPAGNAGGTIGEIHAPRGRDSYQPRTTMLEDALQHGESQPPPQTTYEASKVGGVTRETPPFHQKAAHHHTKKIPKRPGRKKKTHKKKTPTSRAKRRRRGVEPTKPARPGLHKIETESARVTQQAG